ncbi:integral membrane protein [Seiridium cupressi]
MADESAREVELESFPLAMRQGLWPERRADAGRLGRITALKIAVRGVSVGIGSKNDRLNTWLQAEAEKFYIAWITIYVVGVALIKSSVCTTLIRIAAEAHRFMRIAVWALLDENERQAASVWTLVCGFSCVSHHYCTSSIYFSLQAANGNLMYYMGYIVLLSSVETGIGCIAASLPSTRAFYLRVRGLDSSKPASTPNAKSLVTIGGGIVDGNRSVPNRKVFTKSTDRSTTTACVVGGAGDWERLHDDDSDKGILLNGKNRGIRADYSYAVELEPVKTSSTTLFNKDVRASQRPGCPRRYVGALYGQSHLDPSSGGGGIDTFLNLVNYNPESTCMCSWDG